MCLYAAVATSLSQDRGHLRHSSGHQALFYLGLNVDPEPASSWAARTSAIAGEVLINFGKWFLIMMNFVSISLLVSLEMVKFAQGTFIEKDWMIYDEEKDLPAKV